MVKKNVCIEFEPRARKVYLELFNTSNKKQNKILYKAINEKIGFIQQDVHYGEPISKKLIPYPKNISNLFWVKLPFGWRMLYTLKGNEVVIIAFVIDVLDHKEYERLFGY